LQLQEAQQVYVLGPDPPDHLEVYVGPQSPIIVRTARLFAEIRQPHLAISLHSQGRRSWRMLQIPAAGGCRVWHIRNSSYSILLDHKDCRFSRALGP
jgi:hypothetical protein